MSSSELMMPHWLSHSNQLRLESPIDSTDDAEDDDVSDVTESSGHSDDSKEYDDDDFDNRSLEIDEEERNKISAQINPDDEEEEARGVVEDLSEDDEEEIVEKEDSDQEKDRPENDVHVSPAFHNSFRVDDNDDVDKHQLHTTVAGPDDGETSMTESAESRTLESYGLIQKLESERKQLLQELHRDEQHRQYFINKLKTITHELECLHQTEANGVQLDIARRRLEMEAYKVQEAMQQKLGLQEESKLRQDAFMDRVQNIETQIILLQRQARRVGKVKVDQKEGQGGIDQDRTEVNENNLPPLSSQSGSAHFADITDGIAPGIPMSANHLSPHCISWSSHREGGSLFSSLSPSQDVNSLSFSSMNSISSMGGKVSALQSPTLSKPSESGEQANNSGTKVEMVYSLLSMLGTHDKEDMSRTLFAMSQSQDNCIAMRQAGCLPLLLQVLHGSDKDGGILGNTRGSKTARARASAALHNIVHCNHDDKRGRREARTLRLLEQIRAHCDQQRGDLDRNEQETQSNCNTDMDHHPGAAIAALMKLSFDEDYRHSICTLGGLQAIADLLEIDNREIIPMNDYSTTIRRYSCMALTNLTFGDGKNKALLCSAHSAMEALTDQLRSTNEDLIQAAASVLRNLSWRADLASKRTLREIGVVTTLMRAAMNVKKETTLKSILSALWNLSSHCSENKAEICSVEGALQFLVGLLTYKSTAKTLAIIENGGGILRNVSSHIAIREDYRQILRKLDCLKVLLCHLKSPSLTIVSNACGTLWNLSARCEEDQNALRDMGAISMLRNLVHSRHKMISSGSSAALKNLLTSIPPGKSMDSDRTGGSPRPSLHVRRQRALEAEIDHNLSETCENVDSPRNSPTEIVHRSESEPRRFVYHLNSGNGGNGNGQRLEEDTRKHMTRRQMMPRNGFENGPNFEISPSGRVARAGSQDSVGSTHSDISHDRTMNHNTLSTTSFLLNKRQGNSLEKSGSHSTVNDGTSYHKSAFKIAPDFSTQTDQSSFNSSSFVNPHDMPGYISNCNPNNINSHYNLAWQKLPSNNSSRLNHEVAKITDNLQRSSSLTRSAPSHCQTFCPLDMTNNQHQQQSLLERLAKSSSGLNGNCNLNNSVTVTKINFDDVIDYSNNFTLSIAADRNSGQLANYNKKHQDESTFDRSNKQAMNSLMNRSYDPSHSANSYVYCMPVTIENVKKDILYHLPDTLMGYPGVPAINIQDCPGIEEKVEFSIQKHHKEQVEETSMASRSSTSMESLSSSESDGVQINDVSNISHVSEGTVKSNENLDLTSNPGTHAPSANKLKSLIITPKSRNVVAKQSLNFDKSPPSLKPESFISFAAFDEENKPIHFAMKNPDSPLSQPFPRFDIGQLPGFSLFHDEEEPPHLTFSTFQKNFQPPNSNQSNHFATRLCTPRANTLPTLLEQTAETDSVSFVSNDQVINTKGMSIKNIIEPASQTLLSTITETKLLNLNQDDKKCIHTEQDVVDSHIVSQPLQTSSFTNSTKNQKFKTLAHGDNLNKSDEHQKSSDSERSEGVEDILLQQQTDPSISQPIATLSERLEQIASVNAVKKKSGIPMKMGIRTFSKLPTKTCSIPRPSTIKPEPSAVRPGSNVYGEDIRSSSISMQIEELDLAKEEHERQHNEYFNQNTKQLCSLQNPYEGKFYNKSHDQSRLAIYDNVKNKTDSLISVNHKSLICSKENLFSCTYPDTIKDNNMEETTETTGTMSQFKDDVDTSDTSSTAESSDESRSSNAENDSGYQRIVSSEINQKLSRPDMQSFIEQTKQAQKDLTRNEEIDYKASHSSGVALEIFNDEEEPISVPTNKHAFCANDDQNDSKDYTIKKSILNKISSDETSVNKSSIAQVQKGDSNEETVNDSDSEIRQKIFYLADTSECSSDTSSVHSHSNVFTIDQLDLSSNEDVNTADDSAVLGINHELNNSHDSSSEKLKNCNSFYRDQSLQGQSTPSSYQKSKLPILHNNVRKDSKTKIPGPIKEKEIENFYAKNTPLNTSNEYNSSSEADPDSHSSMSHEHSSSENSMSHSCSDTPYLDLDLQDPPLLSRISRCNTWCQQSNRCRTNADGDVDEDDDDYLLEDISPEETERLLTENANLIMSEIQITKLSSSSVDEDLFIENETISLVSNGYTSDTNSEVSATWSATSDKTGNYLAPPLTKKQNKATNSTQKCGPRFVKPDSIQNHLNKTSPQKDEIKSVRGRRKPLYPGKSTNVVVPVRGNIKVLTPKGKVINIQADRSRIVTQNGLSKVDLGPSTLTSKKISPKVSNLTTTVSPKTLNVPSNITKSKSPHQKILHRRSRSAGPITTPGKNITPQTGINKREHKISVPTKLSVQASQNKSNKTTPKVGEVNKSKLSVPAGSSSIVQASGVTLDQNKTLMGANVSQNQSRIPKGSSPGQSKIPSSVSGNKNNNNSLTSANNKKNNKPTGQTIRSRSNNTLSSALVDQKVEVSSSNILNNSSSNTTSRTRNSDSSIPRRKSSSSSMSFTNTEANKPSQSGNSCLIKRTSPPASSDVGKRNSPGFSDAVKLTSSGAIDTKRNTSSNISESNKHNSPVSATNKFITQSNIDNNKTALANNSDSNRRSASSNSDQTKRMSPNISESNKRSSLGITDTSKRVSTGNSTDQIKRSSLGNTDPNKRSSLGNPDSTKRTLTGIPGRKQTPSKIASLWKKEANLEKLPSQGCQLSCATTSPSSKLPVSVTKSTSLNVNSSSLMRQNFKKKAATLPNSSLTSSKLQTFGGRISKSSTYEKISSDPEIQEKKSAVIGQLETAKKFSESTKLGKHIGVAYSSTKADVRPHESCDNSDDSESDNDEDEDILIDKINTKTDNIIKLQTNKKLNLLNNHHDSLENVFENSIKLENMREIGSSLSNNEDSLEHIDGIGNFIDSSTFRKKKRDQSSSDFDLPNADETCRLTSSLSDSHGSLHFNSISMTSFKSSLNADSFIRKMSIIDILESEMSESSEKSKKTEDEKMECKTKSTVAQGLKKLFSGRQKDKEKEIKDKNEDPKKSRHNEKTSNSKHSKSNSKHRKGGKTKREYDFFRSNIKIEPSTTWTDEDCLVYDLETTSVPQIGQIPLRTDSFNSTSMSQIQYYNQFADNTLNSSCQSELEVQYFNNQSAISSQNLNNHKVLSIHNFINQSVTNIQNDDYAHDINEGDTTCSDKPMTKTEMLLARRLRTNLSNSQPDLGHTDGVMRTTHAVTAV